MASNSNCSIYVGNLDERVSDRVLYDILIQAGRVVNLNIPKDKETDKTKGFAFAEYETEVIAEYAVRLFSGLVTIYNRTLKFAISGKDKPSLNSSMSIPTQSSHKPRPPAVPYNGLDTSPHGVQEQYNGYRSHYESNGYDYNQRVLGTSSRLDRYHNSNF